MTTWAERTLMWISQDLFVYQDGREIQQDVIDSLCLQLELVLRDFVMQVRNTCSMITLYINLSKFKETADGVLQPNVLEACTIVWDAFRVLSSISE